MLEIAVAQEVARMTVREIKHQLAVYLLVAVVFFIWGLKINWWDSIDRAAYDCDNFKMFAVEEIDYACYRLTGSKDKYPVRGTIELLDGRD